MALIGGPLADFVLSFYRWQDMAGEYYAGKSKLELTLGADIWHKTAGKTVLDFGCGDGAEAVEVAKRGAATRVIGLDINRELLCRARQRAEKAGADVEFVESFAGQADLIYALDSFEHFADPAAILKTISGLLAPAGRCLISFGPPWYHPLGSHFLVFPWAHLILSESAMMRWRSHFKADGHARYSDGSGGCNKMTIARFISIVAASDLEFQELRLVPIRKLRWAHTRLTREFTTAVVRCVLRHRS